ncbi:MAG: DUF3857 domain-containing protein [Rickettsiales bacterium]
MKRLLNIFLLVIISNIAQAKWANSESAQTKITIYNQEVNIKKDGSYEETLEEEFEILKETGRIKATNYNLFYNADSEKINILAAKTIYQGKEYIVDKQFIEDKPLASPGNGFDQTNQILIAFPKAEVGAKIYVKYQKLVLKPNLDKFYSNFVMFGFNEWLSNLNIKIKSEIPLYLQINNPENALKIKKDGEIKFNNLEITLNKEIYNQLISEPQNSITNFDTITFISISSLNNWKDLSVAIANQNFNKIYSQNLPKELLSILEKASASDSEIEQINIVTSSLNDKIQYLGDWRSVDGRFMPRNLNETVKTQFGDCKDFSATTLAILTKMGYKAQFALVLRGRGSYFPETLPIMNAFNHVLVKVTSKTGKIYWIDPTNFQSMAGSIFPDIANKKTLILDSKNPIYEKIPDIDPQHAISSLTREITILPDNKIIENGRITLKNEEAMPLIGALLVTSKETLENMIFFQLSGTNLEDENKKYIILPELKSRIVNDLNIEYSYDQLNKLLKTNLGSAMKISYNKFSIDNFIHTPQDLLSHIYIGNPNSFKRTTIIKNIEVINPESLNKTIDCKWVYLSRKLFFKDKTLTIDEIMTTKQSIIFNKEIKTKEFQDLKRDLETNFNNVSIVFN